MIKELDAFSDFMTDELLSHGVRSIESFIEVNDLKSIGDNEYDVFCEGRYVNFWVRLNTRHRDYQLVIHCYEK